MSDCQDVIRLSGCQVFRLSGRKIVRLLCCPVVILSGCQAVKLCAAIKLNLIKNSFTRVHVYDYRINQTAKVYHSKVSLV